MNVFKQFRIDKELLQKVKSAARLSGLTVSAWIRVAILEKLGRTT